MLRLWPFFAGKLAREEATSAFIAMLLDGSPAFRQHFFSALPDSTQALLAEKTFKVQTEVREVDIRLDAEDAGLVVLIENKILASSTSAGQLRRYYEDQLANEPTRRVVMVYLAPGEGVGASEVKSVSSHPQFKSRETDLVHRIGWDHVLQYQDQLEDTAPLDALLLSGFEAVQNAVTKSASVRYPEEGDRALLIRAVRAAQVELQAWRPGERFAAWTGRQYHQVELHRRGVTICIGTEFEVTPEPDNLPIGIVNDGALQLTLKSAVAISAAGAKNPERKRAWQTYLDAEEILIEGSGRHALEKPQKWFMLRSPFVGSEKEFTELLVARMKATITALESFL